MAKKSKKKTSKKTITKTIKKKGSVLKSIWAVFAGFFTVGFLSVATDAVLEAVKIFPPMDQPQAYTAWMYGLCLVYRIIYAVVGGYVTAALAPQNAMKHVRVLAVIGLVMATMGVIAFWNLGSQWFPILLALSTYPSVWYGGKLKTQK